MTREKLSRAGEGLVVTAVGLLFLLLSLTIPDNPVSVPGTAGLLAQARARGHRTMNGMGLLIHQAVLSLEHFTGTNINPADMEAKIRAAMGE